LSNRKSEFTFIASYRARESNGQQKLGNKLLW